MRTMRYALPTVLLIFAAACAKSPQAEVDAAQAALDSAKAAEAAEYAPESLTAAEDAMAKLDAEIQAQQGRFFMFRSYDQAKLDAQAAVEAARVAATDAVAAKERARVAASEVLTHANALLSEVSQMLAVAPAGKGTAMDIAALRGDLQSASQILQEAQQAFDAGRYNEATAKATGAVAATEEVRAAIEQARQARAGRT
ncbi:MAG: hypothetical protein PVG79_18100 [Gemmatimonadales bacterium]